MLILRSSVLVRVYSASIDAARFAVIRCCIYDESMWNENRHTNECCMVHHYTLAAFGTEQFARNK